MLTRRSLIKYGLGTGLSLSLPCLARAQYPNINATFIVINDVHACRVTNGLSPNCLEEGKTDANLLRHIRALNSIHHRKWPDVINGKPSGLSVAGQPIAKPRGVVICGDITDDGGGQTAEFHEGMQLFQFSHRYQQGLGPDRIHFPAYVGLGNHDLDQDGKPPQLNWYRNELRDYVQLNHKPNVFFKPVVPVDNYDEASNNYSWNWGGLHLVQAQRYGGDTEKSTVSSLDWLKQDLATYAADGRPVIIFQHYGWDPFSTERWNPDMKTFNDQGTGTPHWWSDTQRQALLNALKPYNIAGIFHGHEHNTSMIYKADGFDVFKAKAAYMGGFSLIRIADNTMDVAMGEASDNSGGIIFTTAFTKKIS